METQTAETADNKKKPGFFALYGSLFVGVLLAVLIAALALPDRAYSEKEKKYLNTFPALTADSLFDGSFTSGVEDYSADQFPGRDGLMNLKVTLCRFLGMQESNGVYYGKNGRLMERFDEPDEELFERTVQSVNDFAARHEDLNVYFLLAPSAAVLYPEELPLNAVNADQNAYINRFSERISENVTPVDVRFSLTEAKAAGTDLYYHSDHHWTTDGAKAAYYAAAETMGFPENEFERQVVSDNFLGALYTKSGFSIPSKDSIVIYRPEDETLQYYLRNEESGETRASLYYGESLPGADPYEVFFGGNYPSLTIESTADADRTLLVVKDSYANSFIPFLLGDYRKITIIDPRYYSKQLDVLFYLEEYDDVLFLYNAPTLSKDRNLYKVLESLQ